jgi:hypothetical protein
VETANPETLANQGQEEGILDLDSDGEAKMQVIGGEEQKKSPEDDVVDIDDLNSDDDDNMFA